MHKVSCKMRKMREVFETSFPSMALIADIANNTGETLLELSLSREDCPSLEMCVTTARSVFSTLGARHLETSCLTLFNCLRSGLGSSTQLPLVTKELWEWVGFRQGCCLMRQREVLFEDEVHETQKQLGFGSLNIFKAFKAFKFLAKPLAQRSSVP